MFILPLGQVFRHAVWPQTMFILSLGRVLGMLFGTLAVSDPDFTSINQGIVLQGPLPCGCLILRLSGQRTLQKHSLEALLAVFAALLGAIAFLRSPVLELQPCLEEKRGSGKCQQCLPGLALPT